MNKKFFIILLFFIFINNFSFAAITEQQANDVAEFAINFIEQGNSRRDENGYPLLAYALTGNWNTCIKIRNSGYNEQLYYIDRNNYHIKKGRYVELGNKWCMDCGTFVTYMLKKTLNLDLYNKKEPWHVQEIYNDALKGKNSKYFEFVYKSVSIRNIDYSKLQKGDVIARITSKGNHGMLYVGDGMIAHANRDMISYKDPVILGFEVSKLNGYYLPGTVVRIMRVKDGIIPEDYLVNATLTWPDNGETVELIERIDLEKMLEDYIKAEKSKPFTITEKFNENNVLISDEFAKLQVRDDKYNVTVSSINIFNGHKLLIDKILIPDNNIYLEEFFIKRRLVL